MPLSIIRNDITNMKVDAIVNAANESLLGGGGVDGCIHRAAGPELLAECRTLNGCPTGQAKITGGYRLPAHYVIHTVGPIWQGGNCKEEELLRSCYRESLRLAKAAECESIAFPLISAGVYGYPKAQALKIAVDEISNFLLENEMLVYIVIYDKKAYEISEKLVLDVKQYIDDHYVELHSENELERIRRQNLFAQREYREPVYPIDTVQESHAPYAAASVPSMPASTAAVPEKRGPSVFEKKKKTEAEKSAPKQTAPKTPSLENMLSQIDESFSQMLLRKIDEKGIKDSECYKKANVDRKLFSKIRNDVYYKPSKTTAIAFAIALELSLEEARELLLKAGYALSRSNKFDIIIEYFIINRNYDIYEINEVLFAFDQVLLGV